LQVRFLHGPFFSTGSKVSREVLHAILYLLPAVVLAIPLLVRRYPGERALVGLHRAQSRRWARARSSTAPARRRVLLILVRGGRLIGCSLAVRPPPALYSAS
jgi:hypothetical protein